MTETDTTTNLGELIDRYLAAWNEADPARRAALIEQVWAADGRLIDPPLAAEGHAGIGDMAAALQAQFPGHQFRRASGIDAHHGQLRFAWQLVGPDGAVALAGLDVGELADDGRLRRIAGFFGELPARERA
jgi:SnoaL-like domain